MKSEGDEIKSKQASKKNRTLSIIFDAETFEIRQFPQNIWNSSFIKELWGKNPVHLKMLSTYLLAKGPCTWWK